MLLDGVTQVVSSRRLLDLVRTRGTISRVELARLSGLTSPTVTHVVRGLLDLGLVHETGVQQRGRGQPRRLLSVTAEAGYAVGIQVDLTTTTVVVVDFAGATVASTGLRGSGHRSPDRTVAALIDHVGDLLAGAGVPRDRVLGVGLVTHGPQDRGRGVLLTAQPTPAWEEYPLTARLGAGLGLPVLLENDATAAAVGELWTQHLGTETFGLVYMASGIGGAVVVDGVAYRGRASNAVEIGHVPLPGARASCVCGNRGCTQAEAGPAAVVARALAHGEPARRWGVHGRSEDTLADFERVARAWRGGDPDAADLLARSAQRVGQAATVLVNLFDVDTVLLAGPAFATAGPLYRRVVAAALEKHALGRTLSPPRVELSGQVATVAAVGGALTVLRGTPDTTVPVGGPGTRPRLPDDHPATIGAL
ncbi:ROK family transcriptional regulator [Krasilnikoviella flava]|uniref:Sugar kinase of the NBD/HSP70 family, may contain an N-terminal HTH domain n=1 Tax=Krasilnikoviella flava TaxID=526729 RepID=A0A1T5I7A3_9MICO|nr:ROK family transcriptional regulator [Krasilnikoviella flava]SKC35076.1 Sugar kinase of the NBD/HSP70 family, may contain an N-terminal HTH domain [Krasilnikoviella flava]